MTDLTNLTESPSDPRPVRVPVDDAGRAIHVAGPTVDGIDIAAIVARSGGNLPQSIPEADMRDAQPLRANGEISL